MPAIQTINLLDDDGITSNTYSPAGKTGNLAMFANKSAATSKGRGTLSVNVSTSSANRASDHVTVKLLRPKEVTDADTGLISVDHVAIASAKFVFPENMTLSDRKDLHANFVDALTDADIEAVINDIEPLY